MGPKGAAVLLLWLIGAVILVLFVTSANSSAHQMEAAFNANESQAQSAPQQQVVAEWAIRDASVQAVKEDGVRNGLLAICAAMLTAIAVVAAMRTTSLQTPTALPSNGTPPMPPQ